MKKLRLTKEQAKALAIGIIFICLAVVITIVLYGTDTKTAKQESPEIVSTVNTENSGIEITAEEMQAYRENIGNGMDVKKSLLVIFNSAEECQTFIDGHGAADNILSLGKGIIPEMQGEDGVQYFNCVGNAVFEPLFDAMRDMEYLKHPVEFGGAYCYFKRLERKSITDNDNDLKEFIRREKEIQKRGGEIE